MDNTAHPPRTQAPATPAVAATRNGRRSLGDGDDCITGTLLVSANSGQDNAHMWRNPSHHSVHSIRVTRRTGRRRAPKDWVHGPMSPPPWVQVRRVGLRSWSRPTHSTKWTRAPWP